MWRPPRRGGDFAGACPGDRAGGRRAPGSGAGRTRCRGGTRAGRLRGTFDPRSLHQLALHIHTYLDPDGSLNDPNERDRTRDLTVQHRPDGSGVGAWGVDRRMRRTPPRRVRRPRRPRSGDRRGQGSPQRRATPPRRAAGRAHPLCLAGSLPAAGGIATTVIVMMSDQSVRTGTGLDETSHGAPLGDGDSGPPGSHHHTSTPNNNHAATNSTRNRYGSEQRCE